MLCECSAKRAYCKWGMMDWEAGMATVWIHDDCLSSVDPVWENAPIGGVTLCGIMPLWWDALVAESVWENLCGM